MIATLWFLIKVCLLVSVIAWILSVGGTVAITLQAYSISMTIGVFILVLCFAIWILSIAARAVGAIIYAPKTIANYNQRKAHKKGLMSLANGLSAVAAGDVKAATHYTKNVVRYLKNEDFGLSDLLTALTARLQGDEDQVRRSFHSLMLHKETSFLGIKGLLQTALDKKDYRYARILAEKAYSQHPKQVWIIKTLFDLEVQTHNYETAESLLKSLNKYDALTKEKSVNYKAMLLLGQGQVEKAHKVDPTSLPISLALLKELATTSKRRKSIQIIKKLWAVNPHPTLMNYWIKYAPKKTEANLTAMAAWVEKLYLENADNASSALYTGEALVHMGQKDQAKRFSKQAVTQMPTSHAYQLMHQIDKNAGWLEHLASASHDKTWVCVKTGQVYKDWKIVTDEGHFNSIIWGYPERVIIETNKSTSPFLLAA